MTKRISLIITKLSFGSILAIVLLVIQPSYGAERFALVIGNSSYPEQPLKNPVNDAEDVAASLDRHGFSVQLLKNATKRAMKEAIRGFERDLIGDEKIGLFYYAGHGVEVDGTNYLVPVDADIRSEADVEYETVNAGRVLSGMEDAGNSLNMVVLDACRNNPYKRSFRSASRGLQRMDAPKGSVILYAAQPGNVAQDGAGRNGVFTKHFLNALQHPGLKVEEVFKETARAVDKETAGDQVPWLEGVVLGDFYFVNSVEINPGAANQTNSNQPAPGAFPTLNSEIVFWQSLQGSKACSDYQAYKSTYPQGNFVTLAQARINQYCVDEEALASQIKRREEKARQEAENSRAAQEAEIARQHAQLALIAEQDKERLRLQQEEEKRARQKLEAAQRSIYGYWQGIGNDVLVKNYDVVIDFGQSKVILKADYGGNSKCEGILTPYKSPEKLKVGERIKMKARLTSGACLKKAKVLIEWVSRNRIRYTWTKFGIRVGSGELSRQ